MHNIIPFSKAKEYIREGDVLLFRAGNFPCIGWWITCYTRGKHSHAGIAHWDNELYIVEQREFKGGRQVLLESQLSNLVDVYRVSPEVQIPKIVDNNVKWELKHFDQKTAECIVQTAQKYIGQPYSWKNILGIFKGYAPFLRFVMKEKNGDDVISEAHVCSTLVAAVYRKCYVDLIPNLKDDRVSPADLARSAHLHYLFTIGE